MRFIECAQGTAEWLQSRSGLITASRFADAISTVGGLTVQQQQYVDAILKSGLDNSAAAVLAGYKSAPTSESIKRALRGELVADASDVAKRYAADLAIEQINRGPFGDPPRTWLLDRGHELEAMARMHYEARTGSFVTESGLCVDDCGFAYSSDGLVDSDGLIEIKAPIDSTKIIAMWRAGDVSEYMHQMQGGMWITGRKWCDFIMYAPMLASVGKDLYVKRVMRDDEFIDKMVVELARFHDLVKSNHFFLKEKIHMTNDADKQAAFEAKLKAQAEEDRRRKDALEAAALMDAAHAEALLMNAAWVAPTMEETVVGLPSPAEELAAAQAALDGAELSPAAQALNEAQGAARFAMAHSGPPTLRLGQIGERLNFTVTADFLTSMGFAPAATEKNAKLYHEADFAGICAALRRHIADVQARF